MKETNIVQFVGITAIFKNFGLACVAILSAIALPLKAEVAQPGPAEQDHVMEEVNVWGQSRDSADAGYTSPISVLTKKDMVSINVATTEDLVKYEPSLVIRRRFIGDSNGTLGMRGSNMFQTPRSMVFADGVPLHYFLQSRWNGAPRWTMVSASEIEQVEVVYGPFSAEYSGNAMGGVVVIETKIPEEREFHVDGSFFTQDFSAYGFDDEVNGFKGFMSYGDKIGDLSLYLSYNRLENESQPQSFYFGGRVGTPTPLPDSSAPTPTPFPLSPVSGGILGNDTFGNEKTYIGDSGVVDTTTDNFKFKLGYEFGDWFALLNVAYEDRNSVEDSANSYLRDADGNTVWSGNLSQGGNEFSVSSSRLNASELNRQSLSVGLRIKGDISDNIFFEGNINDFSILKDENIASAANPASPIAGANGQVTDFDDSGWQTAEAKLIFSDLGVDGLELITGIRHEAYELNRNIFSSDDWRSGEKTTMSGASGGETNITAAYAQFNWDVNEQWDLAIGGRFESWESENGYFSDDDPNTPQFELVPVTSAFDEKFSPKLSVGYVPADKWRLRYSVAQAYRFPIVEELFSQFKAFDIVNESNPEFKPEDGVHHNIMIEREINEGYLRVNIFSENINDVIESQTAVLESGASVRTFVPLGEVETHGVEFIANKYNMFINKLDIRFNLTYTDSEIVSNSVNPSIEGNDFPRMPDWRGNVLATYHLSSRWDVGGSLQYASDSFGRTDNTDTEDNVMGGQDGFTRVGLKTTHSVDEHFKVSVGVDNLTNESSYVAHPWPKRSLYLNFSYDL